MVIFLSDIIRRCLSLAPATTEISAYNSSIEPQAGSTSGDMEFIQCLQKANNLYAAISSEPMKTRCLDCGLKKE